MTLGERLLGTWHRVVPGVGNVLRLAPATAVPGVLAFFGLVVLGHVDGLATVGLLSLARVAAGFGSAMLGEGPSLAVTRAISEGDRTRTAAYRTAMLRRATPFVLGAALFGCLVGAWRWDVGGPIVLGALLTVPETLFVFESGVLRVESRFARASVFATARTAAAWTAVVIVAVTAHAAWAVGLAYFAGISVVGLAIQRPILDVVDVDTRHDLKQSWRNISSFNLATYALNNGDQYIIDLFVGPAAVGVYALGYLLGGGIVALASEPVSGVVGPRIFQRWALPDGGPVRARRLARLGAVAVLGVSLVVAAGLLVAQHLGILRPVSTNADLGIVASLVALASGVAAATALYFQTVLYLQRRTNALSRAAWITIGPALLAIVFLTKAYGIVGTAVASLLAYLLLGLVEWWFSRD